MAAHLSDAPNGRDRIQVNTPLSLGQRGDGGATASHLDVILRTARVPLFGGNLQEAARRNDFGSEPPEWKVLDVPGYKVSSKAGLT